MSRVKEIAKSSASILTSQFASALISIVFLAYFARVFSKEQMAVYATLTIFAAWNEVIGGLGMGTLLIKEVAGKIAEDRAEEARQMISGVFLYRTLGLLAVSIGWAAAMPLIAEDFFGAANSLTLLQLAVVIAFFMALRGQVGHVQIAVQSFHSKSLINVLTTLAQRALCVIGYVSFGLYGFYFGFLGGTLFGLGLGLWDIRQSFSPRLMPLREIFAASRSYWGLKWIRSAVMQSDRPLVAMLLGPEGLASYHLAKRLYDNLYTVMSAFAVPMGVKFGEVSKEGVAALNEFYRQAVAVNGFVFVPLGFFIVALSSPILTLYAGPKYAADSPLLAAFGLTLISVAFWTLLREVSLRLLPARYLAVQYLVTAAVTLSSYCVLIPWFGATGVPLAMTLGFLAGCVPLSRSLQSNCSLELPLELLLRPGLFGLALFTVLYPLRYIDNAAVTLLLGGGSALLLYLGWMNWCGPEEVRNIIRSRFRRFLPCRS